MSFIVVVVKDNDSAGLECKTYEEAINIKRSFVNSNKYQDVYIKPDNAKEACLNIFEKQNV